MISLPRSLATRADRYTLRPPYAPSSPANLQAPRTRSFAQRVAPAMPSSSSSLELDGASGRGSSMAATVPQTSAPPLVTSRLTRASAMLIGLAALSGALVLLAAAVILAVFRQISDTPRAAVMI